MPLAAKNLALTKRLSEKLKVKHNTGRVYASLIKQLWIRSNKTATHDNLPEDLGFLKLAKTKAYVKGIVNLTRRKNHANAAVAGLKLVGDEVHRAAYREIMMSASEDYQKFLSSGKRQRNFKNAEASWNLIINAHKKIARVLNLEGIWREGEHVNHTQYKKIMAWIYFKWLADMNPRRLEYVDTRFIRPAEYKALPEDVKDKYNWIVEDRSGLGKCVTTKHVALMGQLASRLAGVLKRLFARSSPSLQPKTTTASYSSTAGGNPSEETPSPLWLKRGSKRTWARLGRRIPFGRYASRPYTRMRLNRSRC